MPEIGRKSRAIIEQQLPEVVWEHSHVTVDDQAVVRTFCIYEAPNEEVLYRHSEALGDHRVEGIFEIAGDVTPADFPLDQTA